MKEYLQYSALVYSLPTIIAALDIVSDELNTLVENTEIDYEKVVMLELATANLSNLFSEHKSRVEELEQGA